MVEINTIAMDGVIGNEGHSIKSISKNERKGAGKAETEVETEAEKKIRLRRVAMATVVGTMLEWYDFYLYAAMASIVFRRIFFDPSDVQSATLKAFATFAIGFVARPIGGLFFGYFGDHFGRKKMLVVAFCLMGITTTLIGLIPTYESIGIWAAVSLVFLRVLQGFGAGAEVSGSVIVSYEHASKEARGRQSAWPAIGLNLGLLLSSVTVYLLTLGGDEFLLSGGWRIPFILSIVLVYVGVWVRRKLPETPDFVDLRKEKKKPRFTDVFRFNKKGLLVVLFVALGYASISYIFKTFSLAYMTQFINVSANVASLSITIASIVGLISIPIAGWLCDFWSSKVILMIGGTLATIFAYPFLMALQTTEPMMIYIALSIATGIITPMMFAAQGAFLSRQFPAEVRSTGVGTAREVGSAIAGGLAPLGALSLVAASSTNSVTGVVVILMASGIIVIISALLDQGKYYTSYKN